jgi:hypothetical protein
MFRLIKEGEVKFPNQINISPLAKDFVRRVIILLIGDLLKFLIFN